MSSHYGTNAYGIDNAEDVYGQGFQDANKHGETGHWNQTAGQRHYYQKQPLPVRLLNSERAFLAPAGQSTPSLSIVGRSCRIFHDDGLAWGLHLERHMVSWRNDDSIRIDRFDVRNLVDDKSVFMKRKSRNVLGAAELEELRLEKELDEERYKDFHELIEEETRKSKEVEGATADRPEIFIPWFDVPENIKAPPSLKIHQIILTTAQKTNASRQMEILLRTKEAHNPVFQFLDPENELSPYYLFMKRFGVDDWKVPPGSLADENQKGNEEDEDLFTRLTEKRSDTPPVDTVADRKTPGIQPCIPETQLNQKQNVPEPPADENVLRALLHLAKYVQKHGKAFEDTVREKEKLNPTFAFLDQENPYNAFYQSKVKFFQTESASDPKMEQAGSLATLMSANVARLDTDSANHEQKQEEKQSEEEANMSKEKEEERRQQRLKRARMMQGHFLLKMMAHEEASRSMTADEQQKNSPDTSNATAVEEAETTAVPVVPHQQQENAEAVNKDQEKLQPEARSSDSATNIHNQTTSHAHSASISTNHREEKRSRSRRRHSRDRYAQDRERSYSGTRYSRDRSRSNHRKSHQRDHLNGDRRRDSNANDRSSDRGRYSRMEGREPRDYYRCAERRSRERKYSKDREGNRARRDRDRSRSREPRRGGSHSPPFIADSKQKKH